MVQSFFKLHKRLARTALLVLSAAFFLTLASVAKAALFQWNFSNSAEYIFDSNRVQVGANGARLNPLSQTDDSGNATGFGGGSMSGVSWQGWLGKSGADTSTASFISRVFDAMSTSTWSSVSWRTSRPYTELPNNGASETGYTHGNATMNGNVLLYHLNDLGSTSTVVDTSGNAANMACGILGCPTTDPNGQFNAAARFNGTSNFLNAGSPASLNNVSAITLETWIKPNKSSGDGFYQPIVEKWSTRSSMSVENFSFFNVTDITSTLQSYAGGIFDGRYVYYVPFADKSGGTTNYSSNFVRYDPRMAFDSQASYSYYDLHNVHPALAGFSTGVFDGRYIYMAGTNNGTAYVGVVTRYDTTKTFNDAGSYEAFDTTQITTTSRRLGNAMYDGRYVYFLAASTLSGTITRYDTAGSFTDPASYSYFDLLGIDSNLKGGWGLAFDGQYMYVLPSPLYSTKMVRYNTARSFTDSQSYATFDMTTVTSSAIAFSPGTFDGRYLYFTPSTYGTSSILMRYDTTRAFTSSSFSYFDTMAVDPNSNEFRGAFIDGHYMYLTPVINNIGHSGVVMRYDMTKPFTAASSYSVFDMATVYSLYKGYAGSAFDGRYLYFPHDDVNHDGYTARYDLTPSDASFALRYGSVGSGAGSILPGITGLLRTSDGTYMVNEWGDTSSGTWHHVVMTYDGSYLKLFIDGNFRKSIDATGLVQNSVTPLLFGGFDSGSSTLFSGSIDESAVYNRALSPNEINDHYLRGALRLKLKTRTCGEPTCAGISFVGSDGNAAHFVSTTAVAAPTTTLQFTTSSARYFQYSLTFEADTPSYSPELESLSINPAHYTTGTTTLTNGPGLLYQDISGLSIDATTTNNSFATYQISANGITWYYWRTNAWAVATDTNAVSTLSDITNNITRFSTEHPGGQFFFKIILATNDILESPTVRSVSITYSPVSFVGGGGAPAPASAPVVRVVNEVAPLNQPVSTLTAPKAAAVVTTVSTPRTTIKKDPKSVSTAIVTALVKKYTLGKTNKDIATLQQELKSLGFFPKTQRLTTYFGPITQKAVTAFLKAQKAKK